MADTRRAGNFVDRATDPRQEGPSLLDERGTLLQYLRAYRVTLELKCAGLDAEQLAQRSVPPSTLSLLGLVRHLAEVERRWFRDRFAGLDTPYLFCAPDDRDGDFDGAVGTDECVAEAFAAWREACAFSDSYVDSQPDLELVKPDGYGGELSLRELLVHMVEEYARHAGHADLLRERIDGRVGQ